MKEDGPWAVLKDGTLDETGVRRAGGGRPPVVAELGIEGPAAAAGVTVGG